MLQSMIIPVTPYEQNCSVLYCDVTHQAAAIDPGGDIDIILERVAAHFPLARIEKILLTHGHVDHCGQSPVLAKRLGIPIIGPHMDDLFWLDALPSISQNYLAKGFDLAKSFVPDMWLKDGDVVSVGAHTLQVIHTPGHTPGHVVFYHVATQRAWVGDVIFKGSIGRTDFPRGDFDTLMHSIWHKLLVLGDDVEFVSGHGSVSTFAYEKKYNRFLRT